MSDVKGINKTLIDVPTTLSPGKFDGRVKCSIDTYEASTLVSGSTIKMGGKITKGAIVLFQLLATDALGGSTTMDVGDAEDTDRYHSGLDTSSAAITLIGLVDGVNYETDETDSDNLDTQILLTTGGASMSGTIKLITFYTND